MSRIELSLSAAEKFVADQRQIGSDTRWDGWDIVVWKYNPNGFTDRNGAFRNGRWGVEVRVSPDSSGVWKVPRRYVKSPR